MSRPLTAYAQKLIEGDKSIARMDYPVLVWEVGERRLEAEPEEVPTVSGIGALVPRPGNPLVLAVRSEATQSKVAGISVGRSESNDVVVENESVSRLHALIHRDPRTQEWQLTDVGSRNGTTINGVKLGREQPTPLKDGAEVILGKVRMRFMYPESFLNYVRAQLGTSS